MKENKSVKEILKNSFTYRYSNIYIEILSIFGVAFFQYL